MNDRSSRFTAADFSVTATSHTEQKQISAVTIYYRRSDGRHVEAAADIFILFFLKTALIIQVIVHYKRKSVKPDAEYLERDNRSIQQVSANSNNSLLPHRRYRMLLRS